MLACMRMGTEVMIFVQQRAPNKQGEAVPSTHFETYINREGTVFLTACENEKTVGYIGLISAADEADITNVSVLKSERKHGIGNALVVKAVEEALKLGVKKIFLEVRKSNEAAVSLYKKNGFEQVGIRKDYYHNPTEDALLMLKNIN